MFYDQSVIPDHGSCSASASNPDYTTCTIGSNACGGGKTTTKGEPTTYNDCTTVANQTYQLRIDSSNIAWKAD